MTPFLIVLHVLTTALMFTSLIDWHTLSIFSDKPTHRVLFSFLLPSMFSLVLVLVLVLAWLAVSTLLGLEHAHALGSCWIGKRHSGV